MPEEDRGDQRRRAGLDVALGEGRHHDPTDDGADHVRVSDDQQPEQAAADNPDGEQARLAPNRLPQHPETSSQHVPAWLLVLNVLPDW